MVNKVSGAFFCHKRGTQMLLCFQIQLSCKNDGFSHWGHQQACSCQKRLATTLHQVLQAQPHGLGACWPSLALMTGLLAAAHPAHSTQSLLCSPEAVGSHWEAAIGELAGRVFPSHSDLAAAVLQALSQMYDQWHLDSSPAAGLLAPENAPASEKAGNNGAGKLPVQSCLGDTQQLYLQACLTAWQAEACATLTVSTAAQQLRPAPNRPIPVAAIWVQMQPACNCETIQVACCRCNGRHPGPGCPPA